jgi:hypothetical protein
MARIQGPLRTKFTKETSSINAVSNYWALLGMAVISSATLTRTYDEQWAHTHPTCDKHINASDIRFVELAEDVNIIQCCLTMWIADIHTRHGYSTD